MKFVCFVFILFVQKSLLENCDAKNIAALVISTWEFPKATEAGWKRLLEPGAGSLDAIVAACSQCEEDQCDGTVGFGGSPDENGDSYLDAMIMDGSTMNVGAVANLRNIKDASKVSRMVLEHSEHTLLVGESATQFALSMGFQKSNLSSNESINMWKKWKSNNCQPNFWKNVHPDPRRNCGPYKPLPLKDGSGHLERFISKHDHDTVAVIAIDFSGNVSAGTSTNGAKFKIPGRVGDSSIVGCGAYADNEVGTAVATGDGDVMMRFAPSFHAVELMRSGIDPAKASQIVIQRISRFYPKFFGALISVTKDGQFGASCHGMPEFPFTAMMLKWNEIQTFKVDCLG